MGVAVRIAESAVAGLAFCTYRMQGLCPTPVLTVLDAEYAILESLSEVI